MYTAAQHAEMAADTAAAYGVELPARPPIDWAGLKARRDAYVARLNGIYARNMDKAGIARVEGTATFTGPRTVTVALNDGGAARTLSADHVLIAVGGRPALPEIPGVEHCITSDGFFDLEAQPRRALVVGSGYIGVELAGILSAMGTETTIACRGGGVLRHGFDPLIQQTLNDELPRSGVAVCRESVVAAVARDADGTLRATLRDSAGGSRELAGLDAVLMAIGRTPVTGSLGLDAAGAAVDARGRVVVDDQQDVVGVAGLHCLGDCSTSGYELTPVAPLGGAAARRPPLRRRRRREDRVRDDPDRRLLAPADRDRRPHRARGARQVRRRGGRGPPVGVHADALRAVRARAGRRRWR